MLDYTEGFCSWMLVELLCRRPLNPKLSAEGRRRIAVGYNGIEGGDCIGRFGWLEVGDSFPSEGSIIIGLTVTS